jgi:hypothetical protein
VLVGVVVGVETEPNPEVGVVVLGVLGTVFPDVPKLTEPV